jgi:hypothetical protein
MPVRGDAACAPATAAHVTSIATAAPIARKVFNTALSSKRERRTIIVSGS